MLKYNCTSAGQTAKIQFIFFDKSLCYFKNQNLTCKKTALFFALIMQVKRLHQQDLLKTFSYQGKAYLDYLYMW